MPSGNLWKHFYLPEISGNLSIMQGNKKVKTGYIFTYRKFPEIFMLIGNFRKYLSQSEITQCRAGAVNI